MENNNVTNNTIFCKYCGTKIASDAKICPSCGKQLANPQTTFNPQNVSGNISQILMKKEPVSSDLIKRILYIFGAAVFIISVIIGFKLNSYSYDDSIMPFIISVVVGFFSMISCFAFGNVVSNIAYIAKCQSEINKIHTSSK